MHKIWNFELQKYILILGKNLKSKCQTKITFLGGLSKEIGQLIQGNCAHLVLDSDYSILKNSMVFWNEL